MNHYNSDIRWLQRLQNYDRALCVLTDAITLTTQRELSALEKQGLIQSFEFTYELAWNVIKDFYSYLGDTDNIQGSRDAFRMMGNRQLLPIKHVESFMQAIKSRQLTSHSYNETTAEAIYQQIIQKYYPAFKALSQQLNTEKETRFP